MARDTLSLLLLALVVVYPPCSTRADDIKLLQGGWEVTESVVKGERSKSPGPMLVVFDADRVEIGGIFGKQGVVKLDESRFPKSIDITLEPRTVGEKESGEKRVMQGIYELDRDDLKIAFPEKDGDARPTKLEPNYIILRRRVIKGDLEVLNGGWRLPDIRSIRGDGKTVVTLRFDAMRNLLIVNIDEYANGRGFHGQKTVLTMEGIGKTDSEQYLEVADHKGNSPTARIAYKVEKERLRLQGKVQLDALRFIDLSGDWQKK